MATAAGSGGSGGPEGKSNQPFREKLVLTWQCQVCMRDCVTVGDESRCICNHRLREHKLVTTRAGRQLYVCAVPRCKCKGFLYHVTTGSWNCRCRCKHRHTDHDPAKPPCVGAGGVVFVVVLALAAIFVGVGCSGGSSAAHEAHTWRAHEPMAHAHWLRSHSSATSLGVIDYAKSQLPLFPRPQVPLHQTWLSVHGI